MRRAMVSSSKRLSVVLVLLILLGGCTLSPFPASRSVGDRSRSSQGNLTQNQFPTSSVVFVGDGDTLRVRTSNGTVTVRLACVDAPEQGQAGGDISTNRLNQILPVGERVRLRVVDTDRYGRTVAEIYRGSQSINLQLVQEGMAVIYPPYFDRCASTRSQYLLAEQQARQRQIGFWYQENPQLPWEWRANHQNASAVAPVRPAEPPMLGAQELPDCVNSDCDCRDFATQEDAQRVFEAFPDDRFRLDRDGDQYVCEQLP